MSEELVRELPSKSILFVQFADCYREDDRDRIVAWLESNLTHWQCQQLTEETIQSEQTAQQHRESVGEPSDFDCFLARISAWMNVNQPSMPDRFVGSEENRV
ncbi:MAG TPA: hypothetical protein VKP88_08810 [Candidatus Paceibacterota bacterium]|nr:hypothetical protein [Candidatus Paceibacterota bacterium]